MNRTRKVAAAFAVACLSVTSTAAFAEDKPPELTGAALTAAQSRTYAATSNVAFAASIAALQTLGYIDITASKDAGTISAQTETKGKMIYNILWGIGKKKLTQKASILVEDAGPNRAQVRLNLVVSETKSRGLWGSSFTDGELVKIAEPYGAFFNALDAEMTRRAPQPPMADAPLKVISVTTGPAAANPSTPTTASPPATPAPAASTPGHQ